MTENGKKTELRRITADLEQYVANHCATGGATGAGSGAGGGPEGGKASSFADEKCNDAALMLREALDGLDGAG
jgi:hypothetical protein